MRADVSVALPDAKGIIKRMGASGYSASAAFDMAQLKSAIVNCNIVGLITYGELPKCHPLLLHKMEIGRVKKLHNNLAA